MNRKTKNNFICCVKIDFFNIYVNYDKKKMTCPKKMYKLDVINKYINELIHINNFNKYKNELKRSFYNCDRICGNCDEDICNKINKELIQNEILDENKLCNGCYENYCGECEELIHACEDCGNIGMYEENYIYFNGPIIKLCNGCDRNICDICLDSNECNECQLEYCFDCLNVDEICVECVNENK
tara:strand:- start:85 stop:639 length:555 start_codon:yes stop_codon:yes gene_type:complete